MDTILSASFLTALFASGVRQSIPLIYGSVGDAVSERAGVMGISLEGEMLFGAFFSYLVALRTGSLWIGVLAGAAAGMLSSLIVAVWSVWLRQDQSIIGIMFNILAVGFTNFLNRMIFGTSNANITIETFQPIAIPGLSRVPVLGEIFFNQNILTYLSVVLAAVVFWVLRKTKLGLQLTAVGENPKAAQASGIQVYRFRLAALYVLRLPGWHRRSVPDPWLRGHLYGVHLRGPRLHLPGHRHPLPLEPPGGPGHLLRLRLHPGLADPLAGTGLRPAVPGIRGSAVPGHHPGPGHRRPQYPRAPGTWRSL